MSLDARMHVGVPHGRKVGLLYLFRRAARLAHETRSAQRGKGAWRVGKAEREQTIPGFCLWRALRFSCGERAARELWM